MLAVFVGHALRTRKTGGREMQANHKKRQNRMDAHEQTPFGKLRKTSSRYGSFSVWLAAPGFRLA
jgi:hypothetical protein